MSTPAEFIEHTQLRPDCSSQEVKQVCEEALKFGFAGVCIPPYFVREARRILGEESPIKIVTVVGFPMGYTAIAAKSEEIKRAIDESADEIDAVINISALKSGNWNHVQHDVEGIARAIHMRGCTSKLILECGLLTEEEIRRASGIAMDAGIHYLKTGTGFHGHPATVEMIRLLRSIGGDRVKIKAAGGIRTAEAANVLLEAGADRIGTSAGPTLVGKS